MTRFVSIGVVLAAGFAALCAASLAIGTQSVNPFVALEAWIAGKAPHESPELSIVYTLRLPRTLAALLAGAGLALAGAAFQALLRNPLATPFTLGVANAGALGAWLSLLVIDAGILAAAILGVPTKTICAFVFAGIDVLLVYSFAVRKGTASPAVLLLAGVTLGMLANAGIMFSRYLASPTRLVVMDRWLMGGVDIVGYRPVFMLAVGVVPGLILLWAMAGALDQWGFSPELAAGRGVRPARLQAAVFLIGSLITASIVAEVGPIGFVGLIVPHCVRFFTGPRHWLLLPFSALAGASFLCLCDIGARVILPGETPLGIVTTLLGAPVFLYFLVRRRLVSWP